MDETEEYISLIGSRQVMVSRGEVSLRDLESYKNTNASLLCDIVIVAQQTCI